MNIVVAFRRWPVRKQVFFILCLGVFFVQVPIGWAAPEAATFFISDEVSGTGLASRNAVDGLDDTWRTAVTAIGAASFHAGTVFDPTSPTVLSLSNGFTVGVSLRDMNGSDPLIGAAASTQGSAGSTSSNTMQDDAPKPQSLLGQAYYNESGGSTTSRNALLFTFSSPIRAFGAWFGDIETRTDGSGTPATVRLLDATGTQIGSDMTLEPTEPNQQLCGAPVDDDFRGCGNRTTRWIGFVADATTPVSQMLVIVGDDDTTPGSDNGNGERLSFMGATVGLSPTAVSLAQLTAQSNHVWPVAFSFLLLMAMLIIATLYIWQRQRA